MINTNLTKVAIIHFSVYAAIFYTLGMLKGTLCIYLAYKLVNMVLNKFFNITLMRGCDLIMYLEEEITDGRKSQGGRSKVTPKHCSL